jgi:hypothetical protein
MATARFRGVEDESATQVYTNSTDTDDYIQLWVRNIGKTLVFAADEKRNKIGLDSWGPPDHIAGVDGVQPEAARVQRLKVPPGGRILLVCGERVGTEEGTSAFECVFEWEIS